MRIIKKILSDNKKAWNSHLKYDIWENIINTKISTSISSYQLIYGMDAILSINLTLPVMKLFQEIGEDTNDMTRRINQIIEVQKTREQVNEKFQENQDKIKVIFDKKAKNINFLLEDLVLRWDARREDLGKHGKFDNFWFGPYKITDVEGKNSFSLQTLNGEVLEAPVNGHYLKKFFQKITLIVFPL